MHDRKDILVEKGRIHSRLEDGAFQVMPGFLEAGRHELGRAIGVVNVSWPVMNVEELPGLCNGTEQRIVAASPLLALIESDRCTFGVALGGLN